MHMGIFLVMLVASAPLQHDHAQQDHGQHDHHQHGHPGKADAAAAAELIVTINPEARVSVAKGLPIPVVPCGTEAPVRVRVINQGFVTAPLVATLDPVGERHVALRFTPARLSGRLDESQEMGLVSIGSNPAEVTIAFSISQEIGDLGARDRTHLLVACR